MKLEITNKRNSANFYMTQQFHSQGYTKKNQDLYPHKNLYTDVDSGLTHGCQKHGNNPNAHCLMNG